MSPQLDPGYIKQLLLSLAALLYTLYRFFRRWHEARLLQDTPLARVRSAPQGYVKLTGLAHALPGTPMRAPLSGRACVWWTFKVEERVSTFGRGRWQTTDGGTSDSPFALKDADGQCLVNPLDAEIEPSETNVWIGGCEECWPGGTPPSGRFRANLALMGVGGDRRLRESLILEDAKVSVLGELRTDTGGATNAVEDEAAVLLSQWKHDQPALLARFDADHDGRLNAAEWDTVRAAAAEQIQHNRLQARPAERLSILAKPHDARPFLIAALALVAVALAASCYAISHLHSVS
jgi:hypothetical protein